FKKHIVVANSTTEAEYVAALSCCSQTGLPEFADDTITDYTRPSPSVESNPNDLQNSSSSASENGESTGSILSKLEIKFMRFRDSPTVVKTDKKETIRKTTVKYAELYRKTSKKSNVRGNQRNWNNLKSQQLGKNFVMKRACYNCGSVDHLSYDYSKWVDHGRSWAKNNNTHKSRTPKTGNSHNHIDDKGYWDSGCSRHMTGYVSFGQGGCKITGKGTIKIGKQQKASCKTKLVNSVTKPLHTLHMDLFGPTSDDTSGILRNFITEIENLKELRVKIIRCDNGGEFRNKEINDFCSRKGIKREFSNAKTPQQNGIAERRNRTLIEAARTMLADAKLPVTFWGETVNTAWKFEAKRDEGYFIRYSMSSKAFRVFNKRTKRVEENLHVNLLENKAIEKGTKDGASQEVKKDVSSLRYIALLNWVHEALLESSSSTAQDTYNADAPESSGNSNPTATSTNPPADQMETLAVETLIPTVSSPVLTTCLNDSPEPSSDIGLISKRVTSQDNMPSLDNILTLTNRFEDILGVTTNTNDTNRVEADLGNMEDNILASPTPTLRIHKDHPKSQIIEPKKISDALQDPIWVEAMQEELLQFKIQNDERGIVIRNKDRLVAQGYTQEEGIDYDKVFAPVARIEAIRLFLAYASFMGFTVYQMDVKSTFLYGTIDEEVYVMQPPGFQDPEFPARVYKVEKAMYGLHQAPRAWYGTLSKYLLTNGFQRVLQKEDGIFLSQDKYVGDILKKFGYSDVRSSNTPMDKENPWRKDGTRKDVDLHLYRSMIGSLMCLTASKPDIMFVVCACARHQVTPNECHLHAVKRIFRYLKGHHKLGIWYLKESLFDLVAYSDSDYGGATQDCKSTTEGCQFLGRRLISWQCKKQTIMATSTTEAEYVAAASGCGQVL
nr:hypothetical protein [Tanacetum cinerariifolium]